MAVDQAFTLAVEDFTITIMVTKAVTTEDIMAVIMGDTTVAITVIISAFTCRGGRLKSRGRCSTWTIKRDDPIENEEKAANERPFLLVMMVVPSMMVVTPRVMVMLDLLNQTAFLLNRYRRQWCRGGIYHANTEAQHYTEK